MKKFEKKVRDALKFKMGELVKLKNPKGCRYYDTKAIYKITDIEITINLYSDIDTHIWMIYKVVNTSSDSEYNEVEYVCEEELKKLSAIDKIMAL